MNDWSFWRAVGIAIVVALVIWRVMDIVINPRAKRRAQARPRIVRHPAGMYLCAVGKPVDWGRSVIQTDRPLGFGRTATEAYQDWALQHQLWRTF